MIKSCGQADNVKIRTATFSDLNVIETIERSSFKAPYPKSILKVLMILADDGFIVAEKQGKVVGYAISIVEAGKRGHLISIAVDPRYRRKGIGKTLLKHSLSYLKSRGARTVFLEVRASNVAAQALYRSFGFKKVGIKRNYYPDGEDALVMELRFEDNDC